MRGVNTNVLVIDDEEIVRDNIEEILMPKRRSLSNDAISNAASILFDAPQPILTARNSNVPEFKVHKAANGMEGVERVKAAIAEGNPYAVIFLDMRMPGWDGLETAIEIRKHDSQAEIIFVTAFSDRSIEEIIARAGENVGYHCKPYASEEILQHATKAVSDYSKLRNLERLITAISSINLTAHQLNPLLRNILDQLAGYLETDMALMGKLYEDDTYEKIFSIGALEEKINLDELIRLIKSHKISSEEVTQIDEVVLARVNDYTIFAVTEKSYKLKTEKLYLLKLFVQNAAKAIENAELQEKLLQKEKLSAIGQAISMVMHDLRGPIGAVGMLVELGRDNGVENEYLDMIETCGQQTMAILNDFMDFIKETKITKKSVELNGVIEKAIKLTEAGMGDHPINIQRNIPEGVLIPGDESKLTRCITNLLNNAIDALIYHRVSDPQISITVQQETAQGWKIVIRDNGPGIPHEIVRTLFEPFVTRSKKNGTGLGLAIVKQYISAHGGAIYASNNDGAVFTIELPQN